jgi:hypothetical protein
LDVSGGLKKQARANNKAEAPRIIILAEHSCHHRRDSTIYLFFTSRPLPQQCISVTIPCFTLRILCKIAAALADGIGQH